VSAIFWHGGEASTVVTAVLENCQAFNEKVSVSREMKMDRFK
jgi:hypothetical protein